MQNKMLLVILKLDIEEMRQPTDFTWPVLPQRFECVCL